MLMILKLIQSNPTAQRLHSDCHVAENLDCAILTWIAFYHNI